MCRKVYDGSRRIRIEIDGKGKANLSLQGTIINELKDLQDARAHLVIGVPSFMFKDTVDPMSMQETVAQLGTVFGGAAVRRRHSSSSTPTMQ